MQALGAYGFLSVVKGKKYFLKHVPEALRMLKDETATVKNEYPVLYRLIHGFSFDLSAPVSYNTNAG